MARSSVFVSCVVKSIIVRLKSSFAPAFPIAANLGKRRRSRCASARARVEKRWRKEHLTRREKKWRQPTLDTRRLLGYAAGVENVASASKFCLTIFAYLFGASIIRRVALDKRPLPMTLKQLHAIEAV